MAAQEPEYSALKAEEQEEGRPEEDNPEGERSGRIDRPDRPQLRKQKAGLTNFWVVDPQVWWRHPAARIAMPFIVMGLDFFVYGEDPVNDSRVEYNFPVLGHWYGLLCLWPEQGVLVALRIIIIAVTTVLGMYVGRQWVHHRLLRDRWHLSMFSENKGTMIIMGLWIFIFFYLGALAYNAVGAILAGDDEFHPIVSNTFMEFYKWGKVFQTFSVFLDIVSIVLITDAVLQDRNHYPGFAAGFKSVYVDACGGCVRVVAAWVVFFGLMSVTYLAIQATGQDNNSLRWTNTSFGGLTEVWRTHLLSACVLCDLMCVAQDWEFPTFRTALDINIAGTFTNELSCSCLSGLARCLIPRVPDCCLKRIPSCCWSREDLVNFFKFSMTGPWMAYMPLVLAVIFGDISCAKNQFMYRPQNYGQYVEPETQRIWNIIDKEYLKRAYTDGVITEAGKSLITYAARRDPSTGKPLDDSAATDVLLNSRYLHESLFTDIGPITDVELMAFLVGMLLAVGFMVLVIGGERVWRSRAVGFMGKFAS